MIQTEVITTKQPVGTKPLVYVVDDEAMLLELAAVILQPLGCHLIAFADPEEALTAFAGASPRPALLITDFAMHHMNGLELIRECRRLEPNQKILLVSGTVGMEVFNGVPSKPDRFLAKPYRAPQLVELVQALLSN
jgi:CheY-like chemotaxis protein